MRSTFCPQRLRAWESVIEHRDRSDGVRRKTETLPATTFIGRFLAHVLPSRFTRVRHGGFFSNRYRNQKLEQIRKLLGVRPAVWTAAQWLPMTTGSIWLATLRRHVAAGGPRGRSRLGGGSGQKSALILLFVAPRSPNSRPRRSQQQSRPCFWKSSGDRIHLRRHESHSAAQFNTVLSLIAARPAMKPFSFAAR